MKNSRFIVLLAQFMYRCRNNCLGLEGGNALGDCLKGLTTLKTLDVRCSCLLKSVFVEL
jgi:hypothetical protein